MPTIHRGTHGQCFRYETWGWDQGKERCGTGVAWLNRARLGTGHSDVAL